MSSLARLLRPTLDELWLFLAVALPVVASLAAPISVVDLAYGVRAGQLMLAAGEVLRVDPFTYTAAGARWVDQQWGAQVAFALLHGLGGWPLLAFVRAALVGLLAAALLATGTAAGLGRRSAALLALGVFIVGAPGLAMRPQLPGLLIVATVGLALVLRARHPRLLALLPVAAAAAANTHGSFVIIPLLPVAAAVDDAIAGHRRRAMGLALAAAATLAATCLTPWGAEVWGYAVAVGGSEAVRRLAAEWQPPDPIGVPGSPFLLGLGLCVALVARAVRRSGPRSVPWGSVVLVGGLAALGLSAARAIPLWAVVMPVVASTLLANSFAAPDTPALERPRSLNAAIATAVLVVGIALLPFGRPPDGGPLPLLADAPGALPATLRAWTRPGDRVFVPQRLASWVELELPDRPVMVDSRFELFTPATWDDYLAVIEGGPDARTLLRRYGVRAVATDREGPLAATLTADPDYRSVGESAGFAFFARPN